MSGSQTPATFATALLKDIGIANPSAADVTFVEQWEAGEGGNWENTAKYNPLNTTLAEPGSSPYAAGKSVQSYTSWAQGLAATAKTLSGSAYDGIVSALKSNNTTAAEEAVLDSPWGTSNIPTASAAAAYVKAHRGGGSSSLVTDILNGVSDLNPFGAASKAASAVGGDVASGIGSALDPIWTDAKSFGITMGFALVGLVLVAGGVLSMTRGARQSVEAKGSQAIDLAGLAAA